jgi:uncharacterized membrane-anchored protein
VLNAIAVVVVLIWVANFFVSVTMPEYDGSAVNATFPVIMGTILALKGRRNGDRPSDRD